MDKLTSILLVDDDAATSFLNKLLLKRTYIQNELLIAHNGREALDLLEKKIKEQQNGTAKVPNLILLDMNMPVMDGRSFLKAFGELDFPGKDKVVIVVLSTFLSPEDLELVHAAGVKDFVNKPLSGPVIKQLLDKYFRQA